MVEVRSEYAPRNKMVSNFTNESHIGEGFAKIGKSFAKLILKDLK
ncbi:hypothetical protein [Flavobacterium oreochromis]|uniref:Uncharacterized protein n=1 Tax=Flavobacterium oreochromis TaxID=2906078 RepID=A0ABW8P5I1_9FLAO|nr:hypothetical protein [Flavobacterium oreochromis]